MKRLKLLAVLVLELLAPGRGAAGHGAGVDRAWCVPGYDGCRKWPVRTGTYTYMAGARPVQHGAGLDEVGDAIKRLLYYT